MMHLDRVGVHFTPMAIALNEVCPKGVLVSTGASESSEFFNRYLQLSSLQRKRPGLYWWNAVVDFRRLALANILCSYQADAVTLTGNPCLCNAVGIAMMIEKL